MKFPGPLGFGLVAGFVMVGLIGGFEAEVALAAPQSGKRPSEAERGKALWETHCKSCHGPLGHADGPAIANLVVTVPDLAGFAVLDDSGKVRTDVERLVLKGRNGMPGFETTFDRYEARRVLRHLNKLLYGEAKPPAADDEEGGEGGDDGAEGGK
jgi:mono/diheme cytochrome c family protein